MLRTLLRAGLALLTAATVGAQVAPSMDGSADALHSPGKDVRIYLLTMGTGPHVEQMFGHSSIWVQDTVTQRDTVINWGVFDASQPNFIPHFLKGLLLYSVGGNRMADVLYNYHYWNRTVIAQQLNLTAEQKDSVIAIMRTNLLPENVNYRYDYFVDNCSTRPRDIIDHVLGGQLRIGADSVTDKSYRFHALRLMQENTPLSLGVDVGLGRPSDRPVTRWQEMFLPQELHDWVATKQIRDSTGAMRPLALNDRVLFKSSRTPDATTAPTFGWLWLVGAVIAALFIGLGVAAQQSRGARITASILMTTWAAICGILGLLVTLLWTITDHRFAYWNENLLLFNPLWLIVAVTLPMVCSSGRARQLTRRLLGLFVALGVIALVIHLVGLSAQKNVPIVGLALLPAIALFLVSRRLPAPR
ncbi:MAG TPA: DUF4105 domain-containing protein [Gemmatimonadaceae bacterium]|jgi:hypothetical protein